MQDYIKVGKDVDKEETVVFYANSIILMLMNLYSVPYDILSNRNFLCTEHKLETISINVTLIIIFELLTE